MHQNSGSDFGTREGPTQPAALENSGFRSRKLLEVRIRVRVLEWGRTDHSWLCRRIQIQPGVPKLGRSRRVRPGLSTPKFSFPFFLGFFFKIFPWHFYNIILHWFVNCYWFHIELQLIAKLDFTCLCFVHVPLEQV